MSLFPSAVDRLFHRFCRSGDPAALGAVFDRTAPELLRVACYLVGNRADAEDLVQRTFLAAIESRAAFDKGGKALPWLLGILSNHAHRLRRERARPAPLQAELAADPTQQAAHRELEQRLRELRDELGALGVRGVGAVCSRGGNAAAWGRGSVRSGGCGRVDERAIRGHDLAGGSRVVRDRCLNFLRAHAMAGGAAEAR